MENEVVIDEKTERQNKINIALKKSNKLINNFYSYFQVFRSSHIAQISQVSEDEYNSIILNPYCISSKEAEFRKKIDNNMDCEASTLELNSDNFALAFNPFVWSTLSLEQKITAARIAIKKINNIDVKEFVNYNSVCVVMCGKDYAGALNIGSFFREDIDSINILNDICNFNNIIKDSYYHNKSLHKHYDTIFDFETFEEMQYLSPLEPSCELKDATSEVKAFFWDQIFRRNSRAALLQSLDLLYQTSKPIEDLSKDLYNYINSASKNITNTNLFIMQTLGCNVKERDEKYLKIKNEIFNQPIIKKHNDLVELYLKKKEELDSLNNEDNKKIMVELKLMHNEISKLKSQILAFDDAKKHFKDYFIEEAKDIKKIEIKKDNQIKEF